MINSDISLTHRVRSDLISDGLMEHMYQEFQYYNVSDLESIGHVDLPHREGQQLDYACIGSGNTYLLLGMTEGITSKAPFALALNEAVTLDTASTANGEETVEYWLPHVGSILPDENRVGIDRKSSTGKARKDAIYSQALNQVELILQTRDPEDPAPLTIITKSMGSLVLQEMIAIAESRGLDLFKDANVVLMAPAGLYPKESLPRLGGRFAQYIKSEISSEKAFHDTTKEMQKAGINSIRKNPRRTMREVMQTAHDEVSIPKLLKTVGTVAVVGYSEDKLFSHNQLSHVVEQGATYFTPVSFGQYDAKGNQLKPQEGATHNDEQFNPRRVANAIRQYLDSINENGAEQRALQARRNLNS